MLLFFFLFSMHWHWPIEHITINKVEIFFVTIALTCTRIENNDSCSKQRTQYNEHEHREKSTPDGALKQTDSNKSPTRLQIRLKIKTYSFVEDVLDFLHSNYIQIDLYDWTVDFQMEIQIYFHRCN